MSITCLCMLQPYVCGTASPLGVVTVGLFEFGMIYNIQSKK